MNWREEGGGVLGEGLLQQKERCAGINELRIFIGYGAAGTV